MPTQPHTSTLALPALYAFLLVGLLALAGCSSKPSGEMSFNGAGNGSQQDTFQCDGSGTIDFAANLGGGSVTITLRDSSGASVYTKRADAAGQTAEDGDISGAAGQWTMTATRTSNSFGAFAGQYVVAVRC